MEQQYNACIAIGLKWEKEYLGEHALRLKGDELINVQDKQIKWQSFTGKIKTGLVVVAVIVTVAKIVGWI
jgi:hypothetical protein